MNFFCRCRAGGQSCLDLGLGTQFISSRDACRASRLVLLSRGVLS